MIFRKDSHFKPDNVKITHRIVFNFWLHLIDSFRLNSSVDVNPLFVGASSVPCGAVLLSADVIQCASADSLNIFTADSTSVTSMCLMVVSGNAVIDGNNNQGSDNTFLTAIVFPRLTSVAGSFRVLNSAGLPGNTALTYLDVHSLAFIGGNFALYWNAALMAISLPVLTYIGQYCEVNTNNALTSVSVAALTYVGEHFEVSGNTNIVTLSAPAMVKIKGASSSWAVMLCNNAATFRTRLRFHTQLLGKLATSVRVCVRLVKRQFALCLVSLVSFSHS